MAEEEIKRILIFSHAMELGGAERVLLGLLEAFDTQKYSVDLFLMRHEGELLQDIPQKIRLLPEIPQYACLAVDGSVLPLAVSSGNGKQPSTAPKSASKVKMRSDWNTVINIRSVSCR